MSAVTQAFYDVLSGDSELTNQLGTYASLPSVFTKLPLPADFDIDDNGPYILTVGNVTVVPGSIDTKNKGGREIDRDVRCYSDLSLSPATIESVAERVRALFHRQSIAVTGFNNTIASVTGPIMADEEDALGRVITVSLSLEEL